MDETTKNEVREILDGTVRPVLIKPEVGRHDPEITPKIARFFPNAPLRERCPDCGKEAWELGPTGRTYACRICGGVAEVTWR